MDYDNETMKLLRNADWELISLKLLKFAINRGGKSVIADGMDSQDIVKEVIVKTFSGERKWNPQIPLYNHLKEAIRSILSSKGLYSNCDRVKRDFLISSELDPSSEVREEGLDDDLYNLQVMVESNTELKMVFEAIIHGALKPKDISAITGITQSAVDAHKKTLKRYWIRITGEKK